MITVLTGQDTLKKQKEIAARVPAKEFEIVRISSSDQIPELGTLAEPMLFGPLRAYIFDGVWKNLDPENLLKFTADNSTKVFIIEDSIDQRKTVNKNFLKDKRVTVIDCAAPTGGEVASWIGSQAKDLGIKIDKKAVEDLAKALAPDERGALSVSTAQNELLKLKYYANGEIITPTMVEELVNPIVAINIFDLLDAVGSQQKSRALQLVDDFFNRTDGDEKAKAIQLTALLADQLRNILLVIDATAQNMPEAEILKQTGWKSGRLFVMKKLSRHFTPLKLRQTLTKLESLDMEVKSSTMPSQVILDLIIADM